MKTISLSGAVAGSWRDQFHSVLGGNTSTRGRPFCSQHCSADLLEHMACLSPFTETASV